MEMKAIEDIIKILNIHIKKISTTRTIALVTLGLILGHILGHILE